MVATNENITYRITLFIDQKGNSEEQEIFVTFKSKTLDIEGKACDMLIMDDITASLRLFKSS
jgi:hypothetical protein